MLGGRDETPDTLIDLIADAKTKTGERGSCCLDWAERIFSEFDYCHNSCIIIVVKFDYHLK